MRILIITGGRIDEDFALSLLEKEKFEHMIVVDGALVLVWPVHKTGQYHWFPPSQGRKFLDRWQVRDDEWLRQHIALVRHYFPSVELSTISDEDFALIANDALWLHKQVLTTSSVRLFS